MIRSSGNADVFTGFSAEEAVMWLKEPANKEINEKYKHFLKAHGHRCIREVILDLVYTTFFKIEFFLVN